MKKFGKFIAGKGDPAKGEDERFIYYYNADGAEWDVFFARPENKANWYLALDDNQRVLCAEKEAELVRCGGLEVIGLDDIAPWTNAEGGNIYGCIVDLTAGIIMPPPLPNLSAKKIRLWLLKEGKLAEVNKIIAGFESPLKEQAEIEWQYGDSFARDSQFIKDLTKTMNWSDEWLDAEWQKAAAIE